jgi:hypothetical protein
VAEVNWKKIKAEYIRGGTSYRRLAEKYGVPFGTVKRIATNEQWRKLRAKSDEKASQKITDSIAEENASKALKIYDVADKLLDKILFNLENSDVLGSQEVKHYTSALKDIKDIKGVKSDIDLKEQNARIDKLRKEAEDEQTDTSIEVTMGSEVDRYAN